jgi:aminoglycoside 3-N-acetyltransferase
VSTRIDQERITKALRALDVRPGDLLNVKASLRSIGPIEGGADALIRALLDAVGPEGTIITDSFVRVFPLPFSTGDAAKVVDQTTPSYAGALANAMIAFPSVVRSPHPIQKFAAIGRRAEELAGGHTVLSQPYGVLHEMALTGGKNLKIGPDDKVVGVGTTHVAVELLGLKQRRGRAGVNYLDSSGSVATFERTWAGGCPVGFNKFVPAYQEAGAVLAEGMIGHATSKLTDMATTLQTEMEVLRRDPEFFLCDNPACANCRLDWEFSSGRRTSVLLHRVLRKLGRVLSTIPRLSSVQE